MYVCIHWYIHTYVYIHTYKHTHIRMLHVCTHTYIYIYRYTYIYIYIYILKRLRPIPPGLGRRIWSLGRYLLEPYWNVLGSRLGVWEVQKEPSQAPNSAAQARRNGA